MDDPYRVIVYGGTGDLLSSRTTRDVIPGLIELAFQAESQNYFLPGFLKMNDTLSTGRIRKSANSKLVLRESLAGVSSQEEMAF